MATDNGQPRPFFNTATVNISISPPDNFFTPELDETSYTSTLPEDSITGTLVLQFTVSDPDVGPASEIGRVIILGVDAQFFTARSTGPQSGEITTK